MPGPSWNTRPETAADVAEIRSVNLAAFPTPLEADLVEELREDPSWIPAFSMVAETADGVVAAYALLTRCSIDGARALTLGPCAVLPDHQRSGAGSAVVRAVLDAARAQGESLVLCLGHPEYYPRFGFRPASRWAIRPGFEVPDAAMMALPLNAAPVPAGTIEYPSPFGV